MTNVTVERIQAAKQKVEQHRTELTRIEAQEESLVTEVTEFKERLKSEGIDPARIDELIAETREDLESKLQKLESSLDGHEEAASEAARTQA